MNSETTKVQDAVLTTLSEIREQEIIAWIREGRSVVGYHLDEQGRPNLPVAEPPWVPYQLAIKRIAWRLGMLFGNAYVSTRTYHTIQEAIEPMVKQGQIEVIAGQRRRYDALRVRAAEAA